MPKAPKSQSVQDEGEAEVQPHIGPAVELVRNVGYTVDSALADIIDNSLTAGAGKVEVTMEWNGGEPTYAILDDGEGMDKDELHEAMRIGSQVVSEGRGIDSHGRFSVGLKTASFSQGRQLTVVTKRGDQLLHADMDLDHVVQRGKWVYTKGRPTGIDDHLERLEKLDHGTLVVIRKIDRLSRNANQTEAQRQFDAIVEETFHRLEFVFHCILQGWDPLDVQMRTVHRKVDIRLNTRIMKGFDALVYGDVASTWKATLTLPAPDQRLQARWGTLPAPKDMDEDTQANLEKHGELHLAEGFYIYRNRRLICHGSWLNSGIKRDNQARLARIVVALPDNSFDKEWGLDVGKSKASMPKNLRPWFQQVAQKAQDAARSNLGLSNRVEEVRLPREIVKETPYKLERTEKAIVVRINSQHPRIKVLLEGQHGEAVQEIMDLFEFRIDNEVKQWLSRA